MNISMTNKSFEYSDRVRDTPSLRRSFGELGIEVFNFDFNKWYSDGFWGAEYMPHVLMDKNRIISSVSATRLDFQYEGKVIRCVQLGSVMTLQKYRNQGLSGTLLDHTIGKWKADCDLIYLYASPEVERHYTKRGFTLFPEYAHNSLTIPRNNDSAFRKLDLRNHEDQELLVKLVSRGSCYSSLKMLNGLGIVMYYLVSTMYNDLYYCPAHDVLVVAKIRNPSLICIDVLGYEPDVSLPVLLGSLCTKETQRITYCFTPKDTSCCTPFVIPHEDRLFILVGPGNLDVPSHFMFPLCSRA